MSEHTAEIDAPEQQTAQDRGQPDMRAKNSTRTKRNVCPACKRANATTIIVNPGTVTTVCRWCDYESTTVLD